MLTGKNSRGQQLRGKAVHLIQSPAREVRGHRIEDQPDHDDQNHHGAQREQRAARPASPDELASGPLRGGQR